MVSGGGVEGMSRESQEVEGRTGMGVDVREEWGGGGRCTRGKTPHFPHSLIFYHSSVTVCVCVCVCVCVLIFERLKRSHCEIFPGNHQRDEKSDLIRAA